MDKDELKNVILSYADKIGARGICMNCLSNADFQIGYGFDETKKKWLVYQNGERGMSLGRDYFDSEEEALKGLHEVTLMYHEHDKRYREFLRKNATEKSEEM